MKFINKKIPYRIALRLNGGRHFGMGHVVRCIAIAQELNRRISAIILFIVNDSPEILFLIQKEGFEVKTYSHNEADEVYNILYQYKPDIIINDLPHSSTSYMKKIKKLCPSINYDDGGEGCIYADYLIHVQYKTRAEFVDRKGYLSGFKYLILRDEFRLFREKESCRRMNNDSSKILIMMGGSDPDNLTVKALRDLQIIKNRLYINIVIGAGYLHHIEFKKCVRESKHRISVHANVNADELLNLMFQADIGIAHYGITGLEMACTGLPFVAIAHNSEEFNENRLVEYGFCVDAGLWYTLKEGDIASCMNKLLDSKNFYEELSKKGMANIDAKGLINISNLIIDVIVNNNLKRQESY